MEIFNLIQKLEDMIEGSKSSLFSGGKATIEKDEALEIIKDMRLCLPNDLTQAQWISEERQRIIDEAENDAKAIKEKATLEAERLVEKDNITQKAYAKSKEIIKRAEDDAMELRNGAIYYSQDIMKKIAKDMNAISERVMGNYDELDKLVIRPEEDEETEVEEE